ncbi:hypothetical protein ACWDSL_36080 [Streptomyces sp. NPDC000941]
MTETRSSYGSANLHPGSPAPVADLLLNRASAIRQHVLSADCRCTAWTPATA